MEQFLFYTFAAVALLFAVLMLTRKNALDAAICLVVCFLSFAGLYVMLDAPFIAALQVLVYAGAIMMLIIFVIMTVDVRARHPLLKKPVVLASLAAAPILLACTTLFFFALRKSPFSSGLPAHEPFGTVAQVGRLLFTEHVLNFEMISLLLLTALVGALVLGKKRSVL